MMKVNMSPLRVASVVLFGVASIAMTARAQDLPDGAGKEELQRVCGACHGVDIVTSERKDKEGWGQVVDDMVSRGANGTEAELNKIIDYLTTNFGNKKTAPAEKK